MFFVLKDVNGNEEMDKSAMVSTASYSIAVIYSWEDCFLNNTYIDWLLLFLLFEFSLLSNPYLKLISRVSSKFLKVMVESCKVLIPWPCIAFSDYAIWFYFWRRYFGFFFQFTTSFILNPVLDVRDQKPCNR